MRVFSALCVVVVTLSSIRGGSSQQPSSTNQGVAKAEQSNAHGTVNLFLANNNGLVAITDSLLSYSNGTGGVGQKLFQIDDHTICAIAGWFSSSGPLQSKVHHPLYAAMPLIMRRLFPYTASRSEYSIERKLSMLVEILSRILANEADIARASGGQGSDSPLSLTLASYEHGRMKIAQVKLRPKLSNGVTEYIVGNRMSWEVNNDLIFVAAGISDVAVSVLSNPIIPSTNDTILRMYRDALSSNSGRDMSLDLLTLVGEEIVQLTAEKHPSLVGGPRQTATIADGKVELIPLRFSQEGEKRTIWAPPAFMDSVELRDFDQEDFAELGEMTFFTKVKFVRSSPALDNSFFFDSTFQDCKLYYYGLSSDFILDKSNKLINTTMVVVDEKYLDEPDINKIRHDFPSLKIEVLRAP